MKILSQPTFLRHAARALGSRLFHWAENNSRTSIARNGEAWLLDEMVAQWAGEIGRSRQTRVIVDAGANRGDFTEAVLAAAARRAIAVEVHAIDPARSCVEQLERRFAAERRVKVLRAAVGERAGTMHLHSPEPGSTHASLVRRAGEADVSGEEVPVIRLDEHLRQHGLVRIDLLKLDVEGYELAALRGLSEALRPEAVGVVQFEYGGTTLDAGVTLRAFFELLEARGYAVAKLLPRALEVRRYASWMDHFAYANYVALPARGWPNHG